MRDHHLTIGVFDDEGQREKAISEISEMDVKFYMRVNSVQLITIAEDDSLGSREDFCF